MTSRLKNYLFVIRIVGVFAAPSLILLTDYKQNYLFLWTLVILFVAMSIFVRIANLPPKYDAYLHHGMQYMDVLMLSLAIGARGGQRSDFYLGYFLILGYGMLLTSSKHMTGMSMWIMVCYSSITYAFTPVELISNSRLIIRLIMLIGTSYILHIFVQEMASFRSEKDKATQMAFHDTLTNAYNRRILQYIANETEEDYQPFHVVLIDLDDFKAINDTYGHNAGDQVLKSLVNIIQSHLSKGDLCIRYGGEEFLMILYGKSFDRHYTTLSNIRRSFYEQSFSWLKDPRGITFTAGIATGNSHSNMEAIILNADKSLYKGKSSGKNCTVYDNHIWTNGLPLFYL